MKTSLGFKSSMLLCLFVLALSACAAPGVVPAPAVPAAVAQSVSTATVLAAATSIVAINTAVPFTDTPLPLTATAAATPTAASTATTAPTNPPPPTDTKVPPTNTALPPTATATAVSPTAKNVPPTATHVRPSATRKPAPKPTVAPPTAPSSKAFAVTWKTGFEYLPRNGSSSWCQMHNQYQNTAGQEMPFQNQTTLLKSLGNGLVPQGELGGYEPVIGIANPDGTINHWQIGAWYAKMFGWPNGITKFPPDPIPAGATSDDWTWYGVATQGQYCRYVYVKWNGQTSVAEYSAQGAIINPNAALPAGAP